jgi:hypothetical protein
MRDAGVKGFFDHRAAVAAVVVAAACAGCGDRRTAHLVPVGGVVRQGERPLAGAKVIFVPVPPHLAPLAYGDVGTDGRYVMRAANRYPGVAPGPYAVLVIAEQDAGADAPPATDPMLRPRKSLLPAEYSDAATTPLKCEVPPKGTTFAIAIPAGASRGR